MKLFGNITDLKDTWKHGMINMPDDITINETVYSKRTTTREMFVENIVERNKVFVIYQQTVNEDVSQWIVFTSNITENNSIVPGTVEEISPANFVSSKLDEMTQTIGDVAIIKITNLQEVGTIKGKVDTGAAISSLHADRIQRSEGGSVSFTNSDLSRGTITAPMVDKQAVKSSDGGIEYRPVILLDIIIEDRPIKQVQFNLNDRSSMDYKCLVGQNILEKSKFMIDPNKNDVQEGLLSDEQLEFIDYVKLSEHFDTSREK